ncbi:hypothetical protein J4558_21065 [Leptolyngbya sp. 15MV]|nr:hypothetical protein J4558_21065 [Leptolyngbya sp. 15MV]
MSLPPSSGRSTLYFPGQRLHRHLQHAIAVVGRRVGGGRAGAQDHAFGQVEQQVQHPGPAGGFFEQARERRPDAGQRFEGR